MTKEEFIGKLQLCYIGDRNAFNEIVSVYDDLQDRINKAIEYIENEGHGYDITGDGYYCLDEDNQNKLLEILKGDNNEC